MGQQVGGSVRSMGGAAQQPPGMAPGGQPMGAIGNLLAPLMAQGKGGSGPDTGNLMKTIGPLMMLAMMGRRK